MLSGRSKALLFRFLFALKDSAIGREDCQEEKKKSGNTGLTAQICLDSVCENAADQHLRNRIANQAGHAEVHFPVFLTLNPFLFSA
jgi:hypothetical protein